MDFWTENQGHLTQYSKFNTVPSRTCTQNYYDRQLSPQCSAYYGDPQHKTSHSRYWPSGDIPNWTNQETCNATSSQNFPFSFRHPVQRHYSDVGEQQRQEARDWAMYQQHERGMQHEGWSYNPAHCKRDNSKKNESNFRELEAWALRYSHSLPRRRRIEAELRGARQDNVERRDMQMLSTQESTQWDKEIRQQAPNYCQAKTTSPSLNVKDKLSYQTKLYSHPPNYNAPPPYSVQFRSISSTQTSESQNYKLQESEMFEKHPSKAETQELDNSQMQRQLVQERPITEAAKVIEGRKFKLNKKAGGMTIFCLVSRIADTERESLPILQKQSNVEQPKTSSVSQPLKLADEVDFKVQTPTKNTRSPYSKLQAIPICQESLSKMLEKNVPRPNEVSTYEKLAVQSKYPLWRRPSFTSNTESENASATCSKDTKDSSLQDDKENGKMSSCKIAKGSIQEAKDDPVLMVDTSCVVVKLEVLQGPKKEQVHYLSSENQAKSRQNLANEVYQCDQDSPADQTEPVRDFKTLLEQEETNKDPDKPANSRLVSETLEEHAKRICDSTMICPQEEGFELDVDEFPVKNNDTKVKGDTDQTEFQNVSTFNNNEEVSGCKDGVTSGNIKNNGTDVEIECEADHSKMIDTPEDTSNSEEVINKKCEEPVEINHYNLALCEEERDKETIPTRNESSLEVNIQNAEELDQFNGDTGCFGVHENSTVNSTLIKTNSEILPNDLDFEDENKDQEATDKATKHYDPQNIVEYSELGDLCHPEPASGQTDQVSCNNICCIDDIMIKVDAIDNLQQQDSGQVDDIPVLETVSECERNQDRQLTVEACEVEMHISNKVESEYESKAEISSCIEGLDNSDKHMGIDNRDLEVQKMDEKVIEKHDFQNGGESDAIKDKEQSEATDQIQADILPVSTLKDFQQEAELNWTEIENIPFGCHDDSLVNNGGLCDKGNSAKKLPTLNSLENLGIGQPQGIDPQVESPFEEVEQSQDKETYNVFEESQADHVPCVEMSHSTDTSYPTLSEEVVLKDKMEYDQNEDESSTRDSKIPEDTMEQADILENMDKEKVEPVENAQVLERANATCGRRQLEEEARDDEEARGKEPEKLENMEYKEEILQASNCTVQEYDLQQCQWEDAASKNCLNENGCIIYRETSIQDTTICKSTNTDQEVGETRVVCHSDSNIKNIAVILESSSPNMDPFPSASGCSSDFENATCKEEVKYPESLWDAVSRIRKHTAPDSENEEEEVMDNWDRESLADSMVSCENVLDQSCIDLSAGMQKEQFYEDLNTHEDTLSQCSASSQESDGTIVDEELGELADTECKDICDENQGRETEEKCENESYDGERQKLDETAEVPNVVINVK